MKTLDLLMISDSADTIFFPWRVTISEISHNKQQFIILDVVPRDVNIFNPVVTYKELDS